MEAKCNVEVKAIEPMTAAYLRHIGTYEELGRKFKGMIARIVQWAGGKGLLDEKTKLLAIYHDNPNITEEDKLKTSICVTVPKGTKVDEEIGSLEISGGKYAIAHFEIDDNEAAAQHSAAWEYLYGQWLPESGYQPADSPVFEVYANDPSQHPERKHLIDIYLPVKKLQIQKNRRKGGFTLLL